MKYLPRLLVLTAICSALFACSTPPPKQVAKPTPVVAIAQTERGVQMVLPDNVLFASGQSTFNKAESKDYLERIAYLVKNKTNKLISIEGHTDNVGSAADNQKLSEARAEAVRKALEELGVSPERMKTAGFSFDHPIASNATEEGRKFNRRTEIFVLDEKVENITKGESQNSFEQAFSHLKAMIEQGLLTPAQK